MPRSRIRILPLVRLAVGIGWAMEKLVSARSIPVHLDTVGTVRVAILLGPTTALLAGAVLQTACTILDEGRVANDGASADLVADAMRLRVLGCGCPSWRCVCRCPGVPSGRPTSPQRGTRTSANRDAECVARP